MWCLLELLIWWWWVGGGWGGVPLRRVSEGGLKFKLLTIDTKMVRGKTLFSDGEVAGFLVLQGQW